MMKSVSRKYKARLKRVVINVALYRQKPDAIGKRIWRNQVVLKRGSKCIGALNPPWMLAYSFRNRRYLRGEKRGIARSHGSGRVAIRGEQRVVYRFRLRQASLWQARS
jgi:hypothetical protein